MKTINDESEADKDKTAEMSKVLMIYIGEAIEKWAMKYDMDKMPKNIVFKMALTLMNAWDKAKVFK